MSNKKLKVKGVLIDLDGTLVDSKPAYLKAAQLTFNKLGLKPLSNKEAIEIPRRLEQKLPLNIKIKNNLSLFLEIYLKSYYSISGSETKLISKVPDTLHTLSKTMKLALVTMRSVPRNSIITELEKFNIAKYFDLIVTALDTNKPKPSPEALLKCAINMNLEVEDCIIVGDSVNDIRAGKAAGAKTAAVLSGIFSLQELTKEKPNFILQNINSLPYFIE
ncbi:MAG: HAD family hydrolase [Candidatus Bathyarchaeota archaeon]|nr:HAD family hydrolase [Candidatus Bathyarchaeota archaeon]